MWLDAVFITGLGDHQRLAQAAEDLARVAGDGLGAACSWAIASADEPQVALPFRRS